MKGTGEQRQFRAAENIENEDFDFREQGKIRKYFRGTREQVSPGRASLITSEMFLLGLFCSAYARARFSAVLKRTPMK